MRTVIFANGELSPPVKTRPGDIILAADGGAKHCLGLGLVPDYLIGDLDSLSAEDLEYLKAKGAQVFKYPVRKDFTDLELAILRARELGADEILIYGALGSRWDQTTANLLLAGAYPGIPIRLLDGHQEFGYIWPGEIYSIQGLPGDTVSLIPLQGIAEGITTQNLEYPLMDESLGFGSTRGLSNILLESPGEVRLRLGLLLYVVIHHSELPD